jgi:anti-sigma regulatory factor (Ser/Thr protein kinase)
MQYHGEASAPQRKGFDHSALIYGSDDAFLESVLSFAEAGVAADEPVLVAVQGRNVENLRAAMGGEPEGVTLLSVEEWYETSARTRDKFVRWAGERTGPGRARLVSEQPWALGNEPRIRDWARNESVINVAFESMPVSFMCTYDSRVLPEEIVEHARHTHPELAAAEGSTPSDVYEEPRDFCRRLNTQVERTEGEPTEELDFNLADLRKMRRLVTSTAVSSGLSGSRADELALAVNEIASNAVVHGRLPATLQIWEGRGKLTCEITDAGDGIQDVLAGQLTPPPAGIGGRGIWLARMLCDAVEIRNGFGCTVSIHANIPEFAFGG